MAWRTEQGLISTMMLIVGLFVVFTWDSTFPDRRELGALLCPLERVRSSPLKLPPQLGPGLPLCVNFASGVYGRWSL